MSDPTEAMVATVPADQTAVTAPSDTVSTAPPAGSEPNLMRAAGSRRRCPCGRRAR
jgi:hypothetical protein